MEFYPTFAMGWISGWEWIIVLVIVLLLFGSRLPGLGRSMAKTITEFKKASKEGKEEAEDKNDSDDSDKAKEPAETVNSGSKEEK